MAVQHGIWKIGEKPQPLAAIRLDSEAQITRDISILNSGWMLIGRQAMAVEPVTLPSNT